MHAPENVAAAALQKYIQTLRREVGTHGINVVQLQLGTFDYSSESGERSLITTREKMMKPEDLLDTESAPARSWDAAFTFKYPNPRDMVARMSNARVSGSPLRVLHDGVFDVMKRRKGAGGTVFLGRGSRMYDLVSRWVPDGIVGWMLGVSRSGVVDLGKGTWERESLDR